MKRSYGPGMYSKKSDSQKVEMHMKCRMMNQIKKVWEGGNPRLCCKIFKGKGCQNLFESVKHLFSTDA